MRLTKAQRTEVDALYEKHGKLTTAILVKSSRAKRGSLRVLFHWDDDARAAAIGRVEIARDIIRHIVVERADNADEPIKVRAYHSVGEEYRSLDDIGSVKSLRSIVLADAMRDLERFDQKYGNLSEVLGVVREIRLLRGKRK